MCMLKVHSIRYFIRYGVVAVGLPWALFVTNACTREEGVWTKSEFELHNHKQRVACGGAGSAVRLPL